jgi:hypothetical protein
MMDHLRRLLIVLACNAAGLATLLLIPHLAIYFHYYPDLQDHDARALMEKWVYGGSGLALAICCLFSLGSFFTGGVWRIVLLAMPVIVPAAYMVRMILHFG